MGFCYLIFGVRKYSFLMDICYIQWDFYIKVVSYTSSHQGNIAKNDLWNWFFKDNIKS